MNIIRGFKYFFLVVIIVVVTLPRAMAAEARIAVATNFINVTKQIVPTFEKTTGHKVKVSYGSTGKLYAQIQNGAPFDVFLAADAERPKLLEENGGAVPGSRFTYAVGKLVLWSTEKGYVDQFGRILSTGDFKRLAIANPKTAPYGAAAQEVMEALGVWEHVQPRLVMGESIAQTFQFVATGNVPLGFVALAQVEAVENKGSFWRVPDKLYTPIEQQAVLLQRGADNQAAKAFFEFLQSEEIRRVITGFGYGN